MNDVRQACVVHMENMYNYILSTEDCGYMIKPEGPCKWDGTRDFLFKITGERNSDWAKDLSRISVNSGCTFLIGALICMFSKQMLVGAPSSTEAELNAAELTAQDMLMAYYIMKCLNLTIKLPMVLHVDNKGAVDLANNWSVGGRTQHMGAKQNFLRELKEMGMIQVIYKLGPELVPDIGTKNVTKKDLHKQTNKVMHPPLPVE